MVPTRPSSPLGAASPVTSSSLGVALRAARARAPIRGSVGPSGATRGPRPNRASRATRIAVWISLAAARSGSLAGTGHHAAPSGARSSITHATPATSTPRVVTPNAVASSRA